MKPGRTLFSRQAHQEAKAAQFKAEDLGAASIAGELHPETAAMLDAFFAALRGKLIAAQRKHGFGNDWKVDLWEEKCRADLIAHVAKGDPLDVAAYSAFCWARGWSTAAPAADETGGGQ